MVARVFTAVCSQVIALFYNPLRVLKSLPLSQILQNV